MKLSYRASLLPLLQRIMASNLWYSIVSPSCVIPAVIVQLSDVCSSILKPLIREWFKVVPTGGDRFPLRTRLQCSLAKQSLPVGLRRAERAAWYSFDRGKHTSVCTDRFHTGIIMYCQAYNIIWRKLSHRHLSPSPGISPSWHSYIISVQ